MANQSEEILCRHQRLHLMDYIWQRELSSAPRHLPPPDPEQSICERCRLPDRDKLTTNAGLDYLIDAGATGSYDGNLEEETLDQCVREIIDS